MSHTTDSGQKMRWSLPRPAIAGIAKALVLQQRVKSVVDRLAAAQSGFLVESLTRDEKAQLGILLYDGSPHYRLVGELFDWEVPWFDRDLPPAPARVLVGGAGSGRDVIALLARGYEIDTFEPAPTHAAVLQERIGARARVRRASYEDLIAGAEAIAPFHLERYDAVLLGWGSFTHVLGSDTRRELLACCDRLCPDGPILASFFFWADKPASGRSQALGRRLGRLATRALGRRPDAQADARDAFSAYFGFGHYFTVDELEGLARAVGRDLTVYRDVFPHATFTPRQSGT